MVMMRSGQARKEIPYIEEAYVEKTHAVQNQTVESAVIKLNVDNQPIIVKLELHNGYRPEKSWYLRKKIGMLRKKISARQHTGHLLPIAQKTGRKASAAHSRCHWNRQVLKRSLLFVVLYIAFLYTCNLGLVEMGL